MGPVGLVEVVSVPITGGTDNAAYGKDIAAHHTCRKRSVRRDSRGLFRVGSGYASASRVIYANPRWFRSFRGSTMARRDVIPESQWRDDPDR